MLEINLLGQFDVRLNGQPIDLKSQPGQLILAYLVLSAGQTIRRERLGALCWPDSLESTARKNLRHVLWRLRKAIGQEYLAADRSTVTFNGQAPYQADVDVLKGDADDGIETLIESVSVYKGHLLPGFYEDWVLLERERLRTLFERRMQILLDRLEDAARWSELVNWSEHWLAFGQTPEPAYRALMTGYAGLSDLAGVITSYRRCVQALDEELGVEPSAETRSLFERLSQGNGPAAAAAVPLLDEVGLNERYVAEELLTVGGQGEVYRGRDQSTGEAVVIKRLRSDLALRRPELIDRLKQEGMALRQLNHPNIVAMLAMVEQDSQINLVMEYVPGGSLRELLDRNPQLPLDQALDISLELADALSRAHHLNIIHRDLKPGNVLLAADGTPRLTDFGLALLQDTDARLTQSGVAIGSPSYMSPEALQGEELDSTSDIWSFGVLFYEMLAGQRPFGGDQIATVLAGILTKPVPDIRPIRPDLPPDLIHLLDRLLVKDPQERLASMRLAAVQVEAIRSGRDPEFIPRSPAKSRSSEPQPTQQGSRYNLLLSSTSFVGRSQEWKRLRTAAEVALRGQAHCVCILGEAGIGKTRLAEELISWSQYQGFVTARARSYEAQGALAFAAIAQLFRQDELSDRLGELGDTWLVEITRLIPELIEGRPELPAPAPLAEGWQRRRFFEALARGIPVEDRPVLLVFDDLQWLDQETLEWLHYLLRFKPQARLLIVGTFRDDEVYAEHPLTKLRRDLRRDDLLTDIRLFPLDKDDSVSLAEKVLGNKLEPNERESLYHDTEGNPLFIVETIRAQHLEGEVDTRSGGANSITILQPGEAAVLPPKIQTLIQGRLDRLSPDARDLVKVAATIGRSFEFHVLHTAGHVSESKLTEILDELWERRIIREQEANVYDFSHDKIREVAATQISSAQKRILNQRIAQALEIVYGDRLDEIAGEVAVHFEMAGLFEEAIAYYQRAAKADLKRGAYKGAETYLEKALLLINEVNEQSDLTALESKLQLSLGNIERVIQRNTNPKARIAFTRALQLSESKGDQTGRLQALLGLAHYHMIDADLVQASYFCQRSIAVAQQIKDEPSYISSHSMLGFICFIRGEFVSAKEILELVCSYQRSDLLETLTTFQGEDTVVMANLYLSFVLWFLGYPEQSEQRIAMADSIAKDRGLPNNLAAVCFYRMFLSKIKHDVPSIERFANRLVSMSEKYDIGFSLFGGRVGQAYAAAYRDPTNVRLFDVFDGLLSLYKEKVSHLSQPILLSLKARLHIAAGRYEKAQAVLTEASELIQSLDDRYAEVEIDRLQGELWLMNGEGNPEEKFLQALSVAEEQKAKLLQIRTAVNLCQLWQQQNKQEEAYHLLREIYDWFSEGFATSELREAETLLNELRPS